MAQRSAGYTGSAQNIDPDPQRLIVVGPKADGFWDWMWKYADLHSVYRANLRLSAVCWAVALNRSLECSYSSIASCLNQHDINGNTGKQEWQSFFKSNGLLIWKCTAPLLVWLLLETCYKLVCLCRNFNTTTVAMATVHIKMAAALTSLLHCLHEDVCSTLYCFYGSISVLLLPPCLNLPAIFLLGAMDLAGPACVFEYQHQDLWHSDQAVWMCQTWPRIDMQWW